jgi:hypothetical protein
MLRSRADEKYPALERKLQKLGLSTFSSLSSNPKYYTSTSTFDI